MLVAATRKLSAGDPRREDTFLGPLISEKEAIRLEEWINSAQASGATILCGGGRTGALLESTAALLVSRQVSSPGIFIRRTGHGRPLKLAG